MDYSNNICFEHTLRLIPSKSARNDMFNLGLTIEDCKKIVAYGYFAPKKRKKGVYEIWYSKGNKTYNIVIISSFNVDLKEDVYLIKHVGRFTRK